MWTRRWSPTSLARSCSCRGDSFSAISSNAQQSTTLLSQWALHLFVCLRSFHEYEALPTPATLLGLTSSSGAAGRRGTCVPCGALTPPLRTREPGCHGRRRPLRVPQASCWVVPTGCHCPASPVVPWVGPWIWPPRRRRWCWEYWAIPVREDNAPPAPVSVDGEPHNEPPRAAFPPRG